MNTPLACLILAILNLIGYFITHEPMSYILGGFFVGISFIIYEIKSIDLKK